jgi:hypothetical protein
VEHSEGDDDTTAESELGCGDIARVDAIIENMIFCSRAATPAAVLFPPPPPPATFPTTTEKGSALAHTMLILKHSPPSVFVQFPIEQQYKKAGNFFTILLSSQYSALRFVCRL